jgi:ankyrin repeat protein
MQEITCFLASEPKVESASQVLHTADLAGGEEIDWEESQYVPRKVTALHLAAYFGLPGTTATLLGQGHEPDCLDTIKQTPLGWASRNGHVSVVELLLGKGANPECSVYVNEHTPLWWAAHNGHEAVVKLLLKNNADINTKDKDGKTPLIWAATNGREGIIKLFLEKSIDLECKDKLGLTPLCCAARSGHDRIVKLLLDKGADPNTKDINNTTALHWAAWAEHKEVVFLLLERNADIEIRNHGGGTALAAAIEKKSNEIAELLIEKGARVDYHYSLYRYRPVRMSDYGLVGEEEYVVLLNYSWGNPGWFERKEAFYDGGLDIDYGTTSVDIDWLPTRAVSPLWRAAENRDGGTVKLLQSKGAQLENIELSYNPWRIRRSQQFYPQSTGLGGGFRCLI